jgi:hypothetical protein
MKSMNDLVSRGLFVDGWSHFRIGTGELGMVGILRFGTVLRGAVQRERREVILYLERHF